MGVHCDEFGANWPRYKGTALWLASIFHKTRIARYMWDPLLLIVTENMQWIQLVGNILLYGFEHVLPGLWYFVIVFCVRCQRTWYNGVSLYHDAIYHDIAYNITKTKLYTHQHLNSMHNHSKLAPPISIGVLLRKYRLFDIFYSCSMVCGKGMVTKTQLQ